MSTAVQVQSKSSSSDEVPSNKPINIPASPRRNTPTDDEDARDSDDEESVPTINDVESLKKGVVKTSKAEAKAPYTILLVGETGVGKSSVLEYIANVLVGRGADDYDFEILDHTNEQGGSDNQSQTNSARLYELRSNNGLMVRILDTPGLADTRGIQQDELHKKSIATQINKHIDSVTAVLILANGTVPRITVGTDYALSTLSTIFPKSLASNIAFMFTNVLTPLHWNFSGDTIPDVLKNAPQFILNNPVALQKKYLKLKDGPNTKKTKTALRNAVKGGEKNALEMLVELCDWLDGLEPLPTMGMFSLPEDTQDAGVRIRDGLTPMDRATTKINDAPPSTPKPNYLCSVPNCSSTCSIRLSPFHALTARLISWIQLVLCPGCAHPYLFHVHMSRPQGGNGLNHDITDESPHSVEDYANPWTSLSFAARVEKAIRLLEHGHKDMEEKGVTQKQLESMRHSLERMKRRLDLLRKAKEKLREGIRKVKRIFTRASS